MSSTEKITIYTHPDCSYSDSLKETLDSSRIEYIEVNLALNPEEWQTLEKITGGKRTTPVTVEGSIVTVGFNGFG
jgi:glutaredoxin